MKNSPPGNAHSGSSPSQAKSPSGQTPPDTPHLYRADAFRLSLPGETWADRSVYTFSGPTVDGLTHRITITRDEATEAEDAAAIANYVVESMKAHFDGCELLLDNPLSLACGHPAHRTIFVRSADAYEKLYQEQIHVLSNDTAYTLTASFTSRSRKQVGRVIEDIMLSFRPADDEIAPSSPEVW